MNKFPSLIRMLGLVLILIITPLVSSCLGDADPGYRVLIDYPNEGDEFSPGSTVPITIHVVEDENLAEVIIRIGEEVIFRGPPPPAKDPVMAINQEWIPENPGEYTIEVEAIDEDGRRMERAQVDIIVTGVLELLRPDLVVTDIRLVGTDRIECYYENQGADVLPDGRDVWLDIILGPAESEVPPFTQMNIGTGYSFTAGASGFVTTAPISPVPSWPHLVSCRIDLDDQILELDETNNIMMLTLNPSFVLPPFYTFICKVNMNAFGRFTPDIRDKEIFVALEGEPFEVLAKSGETGPMWYFGKNEAGQEAWMAALVLDCEGIEPAELFIRPYIPLPDPSPTPEPCRRDMDQKSCVASGGTWLKETCQCPD